MKKILFDGAIFSLQKAGGISRVWADMLLELDNNYSQHFSMTVLIPKNSNMEWARVQPLLKNIHIAPRRRFRWGKRSLFFESLYLSRMAFWHRPDIWHTSYYVGYPLWPKVKRIATFYDMIPEVLQQTNLYDARAKQQTLEASDVITSISENSLKDLYRFYPNLRAQTQVTHLFPRPSEPRRYPNTYSFPYFLFIGKRGGYKNFLPVLKIILEEPSFSHIHIITAGDPSTWNHEELNLVEKYHAAHRLHNLGIVESQEVESLIQNSELLLYPSLYEGFGLPILEGFQHDTPVLACSTSSIPELTGEDYPLCDPDNPHSWKLVIKELLENKNQWIAYGQERLQHFTVKKAVQETVALY